MVLAVAQKEAEEVELWNDYQIPMPRSQLRSQHTQRGKQGRANRILGYLGCKFNTKKEANRQNKSKNKTNRACIKFIDKQFSKSQRLRSENRRELDSRAAYCSLELPVECWTDF